MSKIIYTLFNPKNQQIGLGAIGTMDASSQKSFTVEEDSADEAVLGTLIGSGAVALISALPLQSSFGPQNLSAAQLTALQGGNLLSLQGAVYGLSELSPYVTRTTTGQVFTGPCELGGWYCSVAAGTITIYDNTSAAGTPLVPATTLVVGPAPIFGPGTNGKLALTVGCHVVLSGAATVRMLVG